MYQDDKAAFPALRQNVMTRIRQDADCLRRLAAPVTRRLFIPGSHRRQLLPFSSRIFGMTALSVKNELKGSVCLQFVGVLARFIQSQFDARPFGRPFGLPDGPSLNFSLMPVNRLY